MERERGEISGQRCVSSRAPELPCPTASHQFKTPTDTPAAVSVTLGHSATVQNEDATIIRIHLHPRTDTCPPHACHKQQNSMLYKTPRSLPCAVETKSLLCRNCSSLSFISVCHVQHGLCVFGGISSSVTHL